ncbi:MAG TPA: TspO/MBR family protein [Methanocella sp.]|nr:TspO/MBR family protein [Methanocella sp.]
MDRNDMTLLIGSLAICIAAAVIGSVPIIIGDGLAWQTTLNKPSFAPPDWIFGPAWTILFLLMAIALYLVWKQWPARYARIGMGLFGIQIILNVLWNYIFFGAHMLFGGLIEISALLIAIIMTIIAFYRVDNRAALMMVPYLLWTCFATALSIQIWIMNR